MKSGWSYTIRRLDRPSANLSENHPGGSSLKTSRVIPSASMTFFTREISRLEHPKAEEISSIAGAIQAQCHDLLEAGHKRPSPPIIEVDATSANSDAANHNYETKPPPLPPTRKPPYQQRGHNLPPTPNRQPTCQPTHSRKYSTYLLHGKTHPPSLLANTNRTTGTTSSTTRPSPTLSYHDLLTTARS